MATEMKEKMLFMSGAAAISTEIQQGILFSKKVPAIKHHYLGSFPVYVC